MTYLVILVIQGVLLYLWYLRSQAHRRPLEVPRNLFERIQRLVDLHAVRGGDDESVRVEFRIALAEYGIEPNHYELVLEDDELTGTRASVRRAIDGQTWTLSSFSAYLKTLAPDST